MEALGGEGAIDFTLDDLSGNPKSLSDFRGRWVWLVFWATWCSVCRDEMPTLESMYQELGGDDLTVLGVAVDQDLGVLKKYVQKSSLTFPILHDVSGKVSAKYRASGIPTVYLVSPDGKLAGVARGALNWERKVVLDKVRELVKLDQIPTQEGLGDTLIPPKLDIIAPGQLEKGSWQSL